MGCLGGLRGKSAELVQVTSYHKLGKGTPSSLHGYVGDLIRVGVGFVWRLYQL